MTSRCSADRWLEAAFPALVFLRLVTFTPGAAMAAPASDIVQRVEVTGAERLQRESVTSHLEIRVGAPYDSAAADRSVKALHATGLFQDVRIERQGDVVVVRVAENPVVAAVSFHGNKEVKEADLKPAVQLAPRAPYTPSRAHADAIRLRDLYRERGRLSTTIEAKATPLAENRVELTFVIKEGPVVKVESIAFTGNHAFSDRVLKGAMRTAESSWLDILKDNATYRAEALEVDRELIRRYYQRHGFPDAKVSAPEAKLNAAGTAYAISFAIEEGERATITGAKIESGMAGVMTGGLDRQISTAPGDVYDAEKIERSVERITLALADKGHGGARVTPRLTRSQGGRQVEVVYRVEPGPDLTIERIEIRGNAKTRDHVIRRELKLVDGAPFNSVLVSRDRERVLRLGFFKSVEIKPSRGSDARKVVLTVEVVEQETAEISYGLGYSWNEGPIADIGVTDTNFLGTGDTAHLKVAGSLERLEAEASYSRPHFLDTDVTAGFGLFYRDQDLTAQSSYRSQRAGGSVRFGYAITDEWSAGVSYTFTRNTIYDVGANASAAIKEAVPGFPAATSNTYYTSAIGTTVAYDTRDKRRLATTGAYFATSQDFAGVGGDTRYIRIGGDARYYYSLGDVTLIGRAQAGAIGGWGGEDVRLLDLYYKGGDIVRGFAPGGIGPRDTLSANQDALGGKYYVATTAEARIPLPLVPEYMGLKGAVFADAGSLFGATKTASAVPGLQGGNAAVRASAGVGLVWDSPLGPLRADYAIPLAKQTFDKTQPWSIGLAAY